MGTSVAAVPSVICANVECKVVVNGKCVEGLELDSCPFYGKAVEITPGEAGKVAQSQTTVSLNPGTMLALRSADNVVLRAPTRVLALVGAKDAGKSSLIASLYDLFQTGKVGQIAFSGSSTLPALEELCHNARAASRRVEPHFERTPHGEVRFYHLAVVNEDLPGDPNSQGMLFGDRAGEEYRSATDDPTVALHFPEVRRADSITMLIDGERMLTIGDRHNVRSEVFSIVQAIVEAGVLASPVSLATVLTKMDLVEASDKRDRVKADYNAMVDELRRLHSHSFLSIEEFRVAAYPPTGDLKRGEGVGELLRFWISATQGKAAYTQSALSEERAFAKLRCGVMQKGAI